MTKVIFMPAGLDGCALYRMYFAHLRMAGSIFIFNPFGMDINLLKGCQVALVQRLSSQSNYDAIKLFKSLGLKVVYDLDDDLWSVPIYNPAYSIMKKWLPGFEICAKLADLITVSTPHLKLMVMRALGKHCPRVEVVENAIDYDWFRPLSPEYRKNKDGKVIVGWAGTDTHEGDTKQVFNLIPELLQENPNMNFEIAGVDMPESLQQFADRITIRDFVPIAEFAANWASWQWDISLAPVQENSFNLSKSNIKMIEASTLKIPCVASDLGEYRKFASYSKHLKQAVVADNRKQWKEKITKLVQNAEYRTFIGEEMYRVGRDHFDIVGRLVTMESLFKEVTS